MSIDISKLDKRHRIEVLVSSKTRSVHLRQRLIDEVEHAVSKIFSHVNVDVQDYPSKTVVAFNDEGLITK